MRTVQADLVADIRSMRGRRFASTTTMVGGNRNRVVACEPIEIELEEDLILLELRDDRLRLA